MSVIELLLCGGGAGLLVATVAMGAYLIREVARNRRS